MHTRFGLARLIAKIFLYTTPIMMITYAVISILIMQTEIELGIRRGAIAGLLWGILFTSSMGLITYSKHKKLQRKYKRVADYNPVQTRSVQLHGTLNDALALSAQALRTLPWIQGDSIEISASKISAKSSVVMGRDSTISISVTALTSDQAAIEMESKPRYWLPVDCTLQSIVNVEEILEEITKLSRNRESEIEKHDKCG